MSRRVVVTGMGVISCLGNDPDTFFDNLVVAASGIVMSPDIDSHPVGIAEFAAEDHFHITELIGLDRVSQFAVVAARQALRQAGLPQEGNDNVGVLFGTGMSGATTLEAAYGSFFGVQRNRLLSIPMAMPHAPASQVSIGIGATGECQTYSTACSSSSVAIGESYRRIKDGYLEVAVTGGAECMLVPSVMREWASLRVLAPAHGSPSGGCRPFDAKRNGFHVSEGAAIVILEEYEHAVARQASILGEVVGYGVSNDAMHITKPSPAGQARAMRRALDEAGIASADVDYINLHGTATMTGDRAEARSVREVFGAHARRIPMSATKSSHGHAIGATGALEFVATLYSLNRGVVPPTAFTEEVAPDVGLNLVIQRARHVGGMRYGMTNSFAFGGNNAVLVVKGGVQ